MRRGLLKDLANTPTQIACGWRLYGDLPRLRQLAGAVVTVDLLSGQCTVAEAQLSPPLEVAEETSRWLQDRCERDNVPKGTVIAATLSISLHTDERGSLAADCSTLLKSTQGTYESRDRTRWHPDDCDPERR